MQTPTLPDLATSTADDLEQMLDHLRSVGSRVRAMEAMILREVDRRQIPLGDGARSLRDWVVGRMDVSPSTADDLVSVARADSAQLDVLLLEEGISFDRVAQMARAGITDPLLELDLVGMKRSLAMRTRIDRVGERNAFEDRFLAIQPSLDESVWRLWGQLPALEGKVVASTLDAVADDLPAAPAGHRESRGARRADALFVICDRGAETPTISTTVIVDAKTAAPANGSAGAWIVSGPRVGPSTLERVLCESTVDILARAEDGTPLTVGTSSTAIPPKTRRWVLARDGGVCTADGCGSTYRLQPHHIIERSAGGDNDPAKLTTLCWYHHHVVIHGRGFRIDPDSPPLRRRFHPPDPP